MNSRPISIVTAGIVTGLLSSFFAISYTSLIFAGDLVVFVPSAIAFFVQGALLTGLITALFSSLRGAISTVQDVPAAMYAVVAATIVGQMTDVATIDEMYATVLAGLVLTTVVAGLGFWLLGAGRLGNLVWYIPFPVTAGFLAGVGLYLIVGAIQIIADVPISWANAANLLSPLVITRWLPAVICGTLLFLLTRRFDQPYILPGFLLALIVGFQLWIRLVGVPNGGSAWSLSGLPSGALWQLPNPALLALVDWRILWTQVGGIGSILVVSSLSMLMNVGGLDMNSSEEIDFNYELRGTGWTNLLLGLTGSSSGYVSVSLSTLTKRMNASGRLVGVALAITCAMILSLGGDLLHLVPVAAVGGLLFYLGLNFLSDWLFASWGRLSGMEFAIVLLIFAAMQIFGALIGVGIGLMLSVALFVFTYSRLNVVRTATSGAKRHSNVERPQQVAQQLRLVGDHIYILELDGFIFFGTGNLLNQQIRDRLQDGSRLPLQYLLLDLRRVSGIDASAAQTFAQLQRLSESHFFALVFSNMLPAVERRIRDAIEQSEDFPTAMTFEDVDRGLEWCEDQLLISAGNDPRSLQPYNLWEQLRNHLDSEVEFHNLLNEYVEVKDFDAGHAFIEHNAKPEGIYFVASGEVSVILAFDDGRTQRLRRAGPGAIFGEMSFYADTTASASVITDVPSSVHLLSHDALHRMEREAPALSTAVHKFVAKVLSERLSEATMQLHALQE